MQQQNIPIATLVDMYERGELRSLEIQRHNVWRATRVRDLPASLYRGSLNLLMVRLEVLAGKMNAFIQEKSGT